VALADGAVAMSAPDEIVTSCASPERADDLLRACLEAFTDARLTVTGACMTPALRPGDVALIAAAQERRPKLGEIVLVRLPDGLRLHRLVPGPRRGGSFARTKADRSPCWDPPCAAGDLLGAVVGLERDGQRLPAPPRLVPVLRSLSLPALRLLRERLPQFAHSR
jgi:hypothetical protein